MAILEVKDLAISFDQYTKGLRREQLRTIRNLDLAINEGEIVAVIGSSGSGKSLLAHAILGILPKNAKVSGTIRYAGEVLTPARQAALRGKEIALIPQSVNFLDPLMRVGEQVRTSVRNQTNAAQAQKDIFKRYHLRPEVEKLYPFQLSGGMARRMLVSMAMVSGAKVIIADEPTPGLDPLVMKEALCCFRELADDGCAVMLITHDLESALQIADRIAVFYAGTTVEVAPVENFVGTGDALRHPYTKALWTALPQNQFSPIAGTQPQPNTFISGCCFSPRCGLATSACRQEQPEMRELRGGMVRCIHAS